jgi:hypothetical protein
MFRSLRLAQRASRILPTVYKTTEGTFGKQSKAIAPFYRHLSTLSTSDDTLNSTNDTTEIIPKSLNFSEVVVKYGVGCMFSFASPFWFFSIPANHKAVMTNFGKYKETLSEGLHWRVPIGLKSHNVFIGKVTHDLKKSRIVDGNGNPVIVSGTVNYSVRNPEKFVINIGCDKHYLTNQAEIVLKGVASTYPYESNDGDSLTKEGMQISEKMKEELQKTVEVAGIKVDGFYLTDVNYAPEIASQMLVRQSADAYMDAKNTIVNASIGIVNGVIDGIEEQSSFALSDERKGSIVENLLVVLTSETGVQPVLNVGNSDDGITENNGNGENRRYNNDDEDDG